MKTPKSTMAFLSIFTLIIFIMIANIYQPHNIQVTTSNEDSGTPEFPEATKLPLQFHTETLTNTPLTLQNEEKDLTILATFDIGDILQTFFTDDEDQEFLTHSYITINQTKYYLGHTLERYDSASDITLQLSPIALDDTLEIYQWKEIVGANYIRTMFLTIDGEVPVVIAEIAGWAFHADIDNNGNLETVATVGTVPDTTIYIWDFDEKQLLAANVNESTQTEAVTFDADRHIFTLYNTGTQSTYKYENGLLHPVQ